MKKYQQLFFDLDGTLWDLRKNTRETLLTLFDQFSEQISGTDFNRFFARYHHHNDQVWALYRDGKIEKEVLRYVRFERAFADTNQGVDQDTITAFSNEFMDKCPKQPHTLDGTHELLAHLHGKYPLHIITNGFMEVQGHKMFAADLNKYFDKVINSEHCGVRKPHSGIFEYAMQQTGADPSTSLMIGDDWVADILGARDFGMDQAYLTATEELMNEINQSEGHSAIRHNYHATYTIKSLRELMNIL